MTPRGCHARAAFAAAAVDERVPRFVVAFRLVLYLTMVLLFIFGGPVLKVGAGCAYALAVLAERDGAIRHLFRLGGVIGAFALAPDLGTYVGRAILCVLQMPNLLAHACGAVLVAFAATLVAGEIGRHITRRIRKFPVCIGTNQALGAALGAAEGLLLVFAGCWLLLALEQPVASLKDRLEATGQPASEHWALSTLSDLQEAVREDPAAGWAAERNPLRNLPAVQTAHLMTELAGNPAGLLTAIHCGELTAMAKEPAMHKYVTAFEADPVLRAALERGDLRTLLSSEVVSGMLSDRALHRVLLAHRASLRKAIAVDARGTRPAGVCGSDRNTGM